MQNADRGQRRMFALWRYVILDDHKLSFSSLQSHKIIMECENCAYSHVFVLFIKNQLRSIRPLGFGQEDHTMLSNRRRP